METAIFWLVIVGPCLIAIAGLAGLLPDSPHVKSAAVWIAFTGAVMVVLAGTLYLQKYILEPTPQSSKPAEASPPVFQNVDRPVVLPPDVGHLIS